MLKHKHIKLFKIEYDAVCTISKRLNKFVVEVVVNGQNTYAYINNTGKLKYLIEKGKKGYCMRRIGKGSTKYRLFAIEYNKLASLIDTKIQENTFAYMVNNSLLPWLNNCKILKSNIKIDNNILDFVIECSNGRIIYTELKSAILVDENNIAMYPDCPSIRGRKHIAKLIELRQQGYGALLVFIVALPGAKAFTPNKNIDPLIHNLIMEAIRNNVIVKSVSIYYDPKTMFVMLDNPELPIILN